MLQLCASLYLFINLNFVSMLEKNKLTKWVKCSQSNIFSSVLTYPHLTEVSTLNLLVLVTFSSLYICSFIKIWKYQLYAIYGFLQDMSANLCFRAQRIFLHNASGWFGKVPLEASGDFGIDPEQGEFHLMCQVLWHLNR